MAVSCGDEVSGEGEHSTQATITIAGNATNPATSKENAPNSPVAAAVGAEDVEMEAVEMVVEVVEAGEVIMLWKWSRKWRHRRRASSRKEADRQESKGKPRIFRRLHPP